MTGDLADALGRPVESFEDMLAALTDIGAGPEKTKTGYSMRCPMHDDDTASATLRAGSKGAPWVVHCFVCAPAKGSEQRSAWVREFAERVSTGQELPPASPKAKRSDGSAPRGVPVAAYDYTDATGRVVARKVRYETEDSRGKSFGWSRPVAGAWVSRLGRTPLTALPMYGLASLATPGVVYVVEGEKDADRLHTLGVPAVSAAGGAKKDPRAVDLPDDVTPLAGRDVVIVGDRDDAGTGYAWAWRDRLTGLAGSVRLARAALDQKGADVSDHLDAGLPLDALDYGDSTPPAQDQPPAIGLAGRRERAHEAFRRWLGTDYDTDVLDVVLATAAVECLDGDPLWVLVLSGSGNAKTETVMALRGCGAVLTSTIASEGALLSATAKKERASDATGGLLRSLEPRGVLVVKDVTSLLSSDRNVRGQVIAALREIHDGRWDRTVGTDGGRTLRWAGRIAVVGAVTTAWDRAHDVIAGMGDRFVIVRADSTTHRVAAGRRAIGNTGSEEQMRAELAEVVAAVIAGMDPAPGPITGAETERLLTAADLVTRARTGVDYDYRGDVIDAHAPEMPTRFAKELAQVMRGAVAIGAPRPEAMRLAIRVARDSMPPLRLAILDDLAAHPWATTQDVRKRLGKPRATVDRQLQALHMLEVLEVDEEEGEWGGRIGTRWRYALADGIDPAALDPAQIPYQICEYLPLAPKEGGKEEPSETTTAHRGTHISGKAPGPGLGITFVPCDICGNDTVPNSNPCTSCRRVAGTRPANRQEESA